LRNAFAVFAVILCAQFVWAGASLDPAPPQAVYAHQGPSGKSDAWRWMRNGQTVAEAYDISGDGIPDVALMLSKGRFLRAEIDINNDMKAEYFILFDGAGNSVKYRDPDHDGVFFSLDVRYEGEADMTIDDRSAQIMFREAVRRRVTYMDNPDSFSPVDAAIAPPFRPPFGRPEGDLITIQATAWRSPGTLPKMAAREDKPMRLALPPISVIAAQGEFFEGRGFDVERETLLHHEKAPLNGAAEIEVFPYYIRSKNQDGTFTNNLQIQVAGIISAQEGFTDYFSHAGKLEPDRPLFVSAPGYDTDGNPSGTLFLEIRLIEIVPHKPAGGSGH